MQTTFIYALNCPVTGDVRYVGKSNNPRNRLFKHLKDTKKTHKTNWIARLRESGRVPVLEILDTVLMTEWPQWEVAYIEFFREAGLQLVNSAPGGESGPALPGEKNPNFGKKHSLASRAVMSAVNLGRKDSEETRARKSLAKRGGVLTEAQKQKLREVPRSNNASGVHGVCWLKREKRWRARIVYSGKEVHLGTFLTIEEAAEARNRALLAEG